MIYSQSGYFKLQYRKLINSMTNRQKSLLPKKLQIIALKLKSFAFMKIFMKEPSSPTREQKVRHYDLELEGATAISSWLKNKLQQVYLRSFDRLKQCKKIIQATSSSSYKQAKSQPYISAVNSQANSPSKKMKSRTKCQTDRRNHLKGKQDHQEKNMQKNYRSEFGQQTQKSENSQKSNLESLLQKVKQVNIQSKIDKENEQYKSNNQQFYQESYGGSRVLSNRTGELHRNYKPLKTKNITFMQNVNRPHQNYMETRHQSNYINYHPEHKYNRQFQTPNSQVQKMVYRKELEQGCAMDKNNLLSLKKWHKNQKRSVIINKIKELENSLMAEYLQQENGFDQYQQDEFYSTNNYAYDQTFGDMVRHYETYQMPNNYSQAYLQQRVRQVPRSVYEFKMRKY